MCNKHSVSSIGTGGLLWLSKGENPNETEKKHNKHSVSLIAAGDLAYLPKGENRNEAEHGNNERSVSLIGTNGMAYWPGRGGTKQRICTLSTVYH
jgi:hypothetical protein